MSRIGSLFSGYGGLDMAVAGVTGGTTAWHAEIEPAPSQILAHHYPDVPNLGDITQVDFRDVEPVDVLTGGFPCQDVSHAGKRAGIAPGTRSGLWAEMARAIEVLRPALVVAENVRGLLSADAASDVEPCPWCVGDGGAGRPLRALGAVLGDLADLGYDAAWCGLRAADVGAPHGRFRVFIAAWPAAVAERGGRHGWAGAPGPRGWAEPADGGVPVPDASVDGWHEGRPEPARLERRPDAALSGDAPAEHAHRGGCRTFGIPGVGGPMGGGGSDTRDAAEAQDAGADAAADTDRDGQQGVGWIHAVGRDADRRCGSDIAWGQYEPAIRRWERLTRPAPAPTEPGTKGQPRLSPAFVEWLMGLPAGWVTDVAGVNRNAQLKALGNGVVWQQAAAALRHLLAVRDSERAAA